MWECRRELQRDYLGVELTLHRVGANCHEIYRETAMETPFPLVDRAVARAIDPEPKKLATTVTAKSFVNIACLIAPDLPLGSTGEMLAVILNGRTVATYPGTIRKFPSRKTWEHLSGTMNAE